MDDDMWLDFKSKYNKVYLNDEDEIHRNQIFNINLLALEKLKSISTHELGITQFMDRTLEENNVNTKIINISTIKHNLKMNHVRTSDTILPDSYDLRNTDYVTSVKNQQMCGSCWAQVAVGALEGQYYKTYSNTTNLSIQQLVDCIYTNGCNGGNIDTAFDYIKNGITSSSIYPDSNNSLLNGQSNACSHQGENLVVYTGYNNTDSYNTVPDLNDHELMLHIFENGPIAVHVCVDNLFNYYVSTSLGINVYTNSSCQDTGINHALLVVGWGVDPVNGPYWICKNSWGVSYGYSGYIYIARGKNLVRYPLYPINLSTTASNNLVGPENPTITYGTDSTKIVVIVVSVFIVVGLAAAIVYLWYRPRATKTTSGYSGKTEHSESIYPNTEYPTNLEPTYSTNTAYPTKIEPTYSIGPSVSYYE